MNEEFTLVIGKKQRIRSREVYNLEVVMENLVLKIILHLGGLQEINRPKRTQYLILPPILFFHRDIQGWQKYFRRSFVFKVNANF